MGEGGLEKWLDIPRGGRGSEMEGPESSKALWRGCQALLTEWQANTCEVDCCPSRTNKAGP